MTTRELYDLRHQTNLFSTEEIGMITNRSVMVEDLHPPNGKTVILVENAEKYVLAEIYALQAENHEGLSEVKVFFTLGEAIDWFGKRCCPMPVITAANRTDNNFGRIHISR